MCWIAVLIIIGFACRQRDLLSVRNFVLSGGITFIGASAINAGLNDFQYTNYSWGDIAYFISGAFVFLCTFILWYRWFKLPQKLGKRLLRSWPPMSISIVAFLAVIAGIFGMMAIFQLPIPGVGPLMGIIGTKSAIISLALSFTLWYKHKNNPILFTLFATCFIFASLVALSSGTGRRSLVGVLAVFPIVMYWMKYRYYEGKKVLPLMGIVSVCGLIIIAGYTGFRHQVRGSNIAYSSPVHLAFDRFAKLPQAIVSSDIWGAQFFEFLGQNTADASLLAIHLHTREVPTAPFHSIIFFVTNPVPRVLWTEKPKGYGYLLPQEIYKLRRSRATWGPGIVGHSFHEGGLHMCIFYGILFASVFRFFDELLVQQPGNPFLAGMLAAASGDLAGLLRGDIGTFSVQIVAAVLAGLLIAFIGKAFAGQRSYYLTEGLGYPYAQPAESTTA